MKINELHNQPVQADTYEASMALNQLLKIGKHAIKIHNMIDDSAEMEAWVAKKIDLAGDYVKKVHGYMQGEKAGLYDDGGMTEDSGDNYFDYENRDEYADNMEKYGDVDKTPLTPQERQQFAKWLMDTANDYAGRALEDGVEEIGNDLSDIEDQYHKFIPKIKQFLKQSHAKGNLYQFADDVLDVEEKFGDEDMLMNDEGYRVAKDFSQHATNYTAGLSKLKGKGQDYTVKTIRGVLDLIDDDPHISSAMLVFQQDFEGTPLQKKVSRKQATESVSEDAGEGHMSKSTLYHTAKYAIELMDMIKKGDDLEGWVQSKLNKAADYLQGVHNYEEYQKLNPYREELDSELLQKHAGIIQKNIDEILARETSLDDVDTKPGMMRILAKRVNEVEKEIAKETRKNTDEAHGGQHSTSGRSMTKGEMSKREKIVKGMKKDKAGFKKRYGKDAEAVMYATATKQAMKDDQMSDYAISELGNDLGKINDEITFLQIPKQDKQAMLDALGEVRSILDKHMPQNESGILYRAGVKKYGKAGMKAIQSAAGKGASHQEIGKIKDKHLKDAEDLEEGLKDWARNLAMAGVIVAGLAGVNSINDAIDNSIPAINAMETALEMAQKKGDDKLAKMIEKDLSDAKIRINSGKDLSHVVDLQNKYAKFIKTEGLAYESKLAVTLNQRLK